MKRQLSILILILVSNICFGQKDYYTKIQIDSIIKVNTKIVSGDGQKVIKGINGAYDTLYIYGTILTPVPTELEEFVSFRPMYYSPIISDDKGNFTTYRANQSVESNRVFDGDGEMTFKFNSEQGVIISLGRLGVRLLKIGGISTLQSVIDGGYFSKTTTGLSASINNTFKLKREGVIMRFYYSINGIDFIEIVNFYDIATSSFDNYFSSFIPIVGDGVKNAKIKSKTIKNRL